MAQIVSRGGGTPFGYGVVTVAELLSRNATARRVAPGSQTAIPVGALLRREGRLPNARGVDDADAGTALIARVRARRVTARRGAIAAGTLLAAGSVTGAALVNSALSEPAPGSTQADAGDPARSSLQAAAPLAPLTTLTEDARVSPLHAGTSAPSSWMSVAFPDTVHRSSSKPLVPDTGKAKAGAGAATARPATGSAPTAPAAPGSVTPGTAATGTAATGTAATGSPATGSTDPGSTVRESGAATGAPGSVPVAGSAEPAPPVTTRPTGDSVTGRLGSAVTNLGHGTPLAPVTGVVGGVVTGVGDFLGAVVHGHPGR